MTNNRLNLRKVIAATAICLTAFFANNVLAQPGTYHVGDIVVINNIIANNGLDWTTAPTDGSSIPVDWDDCQWTSDPTNKRIIKLDLSESENLYGMLDVSGLDNLQFFDCSNSILLTALDVSGLVNLKTLRCSNNQLTELDVSGLVSLQTLVCSQTKLTELDVSGLVNLQEISCNDNLLTALNVSGLVNLVFLNCSNNQLTALDLSGFVKLKVLHCNYNQLTVLNLTGVSLTNFSANNQSVPLTMESNGTDYTVAVVFLNTPYNLEEGLSYSAGILTSNNNTILTSPFGVQTGSTGRVLSGTLNFTYVGETGINTISTETDNATVTGYFDILGRKLQEEPTKGLFIIQYDNGTTKKMMK